MGYIGAGISRFNTADDLTVSGDADIDGTTNLDVVDIDGAVDMASTLQVDGAITSSTGLTVLNTGAVATLRLEGDVGTAPHAEVQFAHENYTTGYGASIGTFDAGSFGGGLVFKTLASGSASSTPSERVRILNDGNLLVGKTSSSAGTQGIEVDGPNGLLVVTRDGNPTAQLNRLSSDGSILELRKDSSIVGTISSSSGDIEITGANNVIYVRNLRVLDDNTRDIGTSSKRFDDIFATNGTIQTSDENEKQNIASLTSAEITAAKSISKLFKTFKWKDKVTAKGNAARTHTGVIAQEVQAAMSAAGLDATKYAFWCSDTWTNDDGNQQTRMGVRYPELLAFVGAATEQRLADIEDRITALENA